MTRCRTFCSRAAGPEPAVHQNLTRRSALALTALALLVAVLLPGRVWALPGAALSVEDWQQRLADMQKQCSRLVDPQVCAPGLGEGYLGLGQAYLQKNRYGEAVEALRQGQEWRPDDRRFPLYLGYVLYRSGDPGGAEAVLSPLLADPDPGPQVYLLLADIYYGQGRLEETLSILQAGLERSPQDTGLQERLAKVRRERQVEAGFTQVAGGHFAVAWDGAQNQALGDRVLEILEDAYVELGGELDTYPDFRIQVLLYSGRQFRELTGAPHWAGGVFDGKIRLPVGGVEGDDPRLAASLFHEYSHALVYAISRNRAPTWLNEGLAELAGRRFYAPQPIPLTPAHRLSWPALAGSFSRLPAAQVPAAYEQSFSLVRFLRDRYGAYRLKDLLLAFAAGLSEDAALHRVYGDLGLDARGVRQEWLTSLEGN